ncbi:hypothetical protein BJ085DRAFT_38092 [Dimargaris cristalligena]|uniref:Type I restriction enzyme R protein N-terminal domain-containing protein n=1 Tax=Dimargaris cristalligena TaxID=215637 RepID=A0A4P9ZJF6_9FUNG|nr:hypothetical protein BJ085DRAFT_38092 [Dimargaris cristalligena]|eukprot:RKP33195.1 hypothetical protein BJ085DRAFT_38092 [Dimargaris cristalligena]
MDVLAGILDDCILSGLEHDVSAFAMALLDVADMRPSNYYITRSEHRFTFGRCDLTVASFDTRHEILVIECKSKGAREAAGVEQLFEYMVKCNFPHGFLMYPDRTIYFRQNEEGVPMKVRTYCHKNDLSDMLSQVRSFLVPR